MVLFSPDFKYKVDLSIFTLKTITLKGLLGDVYNELRNLLHQNHNKVVSLFCLLFYNLMTDRGHLPTKIKSVEFPLLSLFIWNRRSFQRSQYSSIVFFFNETVYMIVPSLNQTCRCSRPEQLQDPHIVDMRCLK